MMDFRSLEEILSPATLNKVKEEVAEWVMSRMTLDLPGLGSSGRASRGPGRPPKSARTSTQRIGGAKAKKGGRAGGGRGRPQAIKLVGGKQFTTIADAVETTGIPYLTIRKSAETGEPIKRGPHKGKRFVYA